MPKRKNLKNLHLSNAAPIITSSDAIICSEKLINISNEKLKNLLARTYEQARRDAKKLYWYDHYVTCFSFGIAFLIGGIIMLVGIFLCKDQRLIDEGTERDKAVENIMRNNVLTPKFPETSDT